MLNYVHQFFKIRPVFYTPYENKSQWPPIFIWFLKQVNHYLYTVEVKKIYWIENLNFNFNLNLTQI